MIRFAAGPIYVVQFALPSEVLGGILTLPEKIEGNRFSGAFPLFLRFMSEAGEEIPIIFGQGETDMGDRGKKDKGKREEQKKALLSPKEKRKLKKEKKVKA